MSSCSLAGRRQRTAQPAKLLAGLPDGRIYVSCRRAGIVIASGLSIADGRLASVQCMATLAGARRQGSARAVLTAIEDWAAAAGGDAPLLQAEAANAAALALYLGFGIHVAGRHRVRTNALSP